MKRAKYFIASVIGLSIITFGLSYANDKRELIYELMNLDVSNAADYFFDDSNAPTSLEEWQSINEDVHCLLQVKGLKYDYSIPVIYSEDASYYDNHNAYKKYDYLGAPLINKKISPIGNSGNIIIEGKCDSKSQLGMSAIRNFESDNYFGSKFTFTLENNSGKHVFLVIASAKFDKDSDVLYRWYDNSVHDMRQLRELLNASKYNLIQSSSGFTYANEQITTIVSCDERDICHVIMGIERPVLYK